MQSDRHIIHILDDLAMGGVTRALKNFQHPTLLKLGAQETVDIRQEKVRAATPNDIAVIHFTVNWKKLGWLMDLRLFGRFSKIVLIEHTYTRGFEASEVEPKRRFRRMLKLAYGLVDQVVAVSKAQREWILEHQLASAQKTIAIPQSRDCDALLDLAPTKRADGPLQLRAFGRFHKQKGFDLLIKAMARIPAELAELKIAGTGPDEKLLRELSKDLPHVEICDPFTSPEAFLSNAEIIAIPSRWEAFGLVGTEARAAGRPILAARVDGLEDQLDVSAFAHAPNSVSSIVRAIYRAATADDIDQRGLAARNKARGEYDQMIETWRTLFDDATEPYRLKTLSTCVVL
ncbi:MAG: glycosyltransferase family 4 protein [Pseudomonadota bacterium]